MNLVWQHVSFLRKYTLLQEYGIKIATPPLFKYTSIPQGLRIKEGPNRFFLKVQKVDGFIKEVGILKGLGINERKVFTERLN